MYNNIKLSEIMTTDLVTASPQDNLEILANIFNKNNFHHVPIVKDKKLVGIISKSDYLMLCDSFSIFENSYEQMQNDRFFRSMLIGDVMRTDVAKLKPENTVMIAVGFFKENLFHAIPIVDNDDKLLGIVTTFDLLNLAFQEPARQV